MSGVASEFGYRRHGGRWGGNYPIQQPCVCLPSTVLGQNPTTIAVTAVETTIATTSTALPTDGTQDVFVTVSFEADGGGIP